MKVNTDKNCDIIIFDDTEYPINGLEYKDSVSLYIVQLNESNKSTILYKKFDNHLNNSGEPIHLKPLKGGYITICHIILPKTSDDHKTKAELFLQDIVLVRREELPEFDLDTIYKDMAFIEHDPEIILDRKFISDIILLDGLYVRRNSNVDFTSKLYYFSDGVNIYKKNEDGVILKSSIEEILEVNPSATNIIINKQNFFSVCYLRKCYVSLCLKLFNNLSFSNCFTKNNKTDSLLTYKRDLVWAALNVIQYMIDSNQIAEALRLLERINGCNGLCTSEETGEQNCGCQS